VNVRHSLGLDAVVMVPNGDPWQKRGTRPITPGAIRLEMVRAAAAGLPESGIEVSEAEVRRAGASFTIDTVAEMRASEPAVEVTVILGADAAALLPTWERVDELKTHVRLAVVRRPGSGFEAPALGEPLVAMVDMERLDVSSSAIRADVARGAPVDVLVPAGVLEVITRHGLYRG
jgi:nicotinate-nucleotide adenylyltransferase